MQFRSRYVLYDRVGVIFTQPSMAQQHFKEECDINNIVRKAEQGQPLINPLKPPTQQPMYGDFSEVPDLLEAYEVINQARMYSEGLEEYFDDLPATTRRLFDNDYMSFLGFISDDSNVDRCIELGIFERIDQEPTISLSSLQESGEVQKPSEPSNTPA